MIFKILIGIAIMIVGGMGLYSLNNTETYTAPEIITEVITEEVDALNQMIEDAITASSTEISAQATAAFNATVDRLKKKIELKVRRGQQAEGELKIEELEKETGEY